MSFKLSRNKVSRLSTLVTDYIQKNEDLDYSVDIGHIRYKIFHLIMDELRLFEQIETRVKEKMRVQKRSVPEGSREWEILFKKYSTEELSNLGKLWN
jgi:hypothetical protein